MRKDFKSKNNFREEAITTNELTTHQNKLPDSIEDLSKFALIGREKLKAVRAEINAITKLKLANDVKEQKLQEAQNIADVVLEAETKIGELYKEVPAEITGRPKKSREGILPTFTSKQQAKKEIGISDYQAKQYVTLAENKPIVEQAKAEAREKGEIVTRQAVIEKVKDVKAEQKRESIQTNPPKTLNGKYNVIYADPPWQYDFSETKNREVENHYPTMNLDDIKKLKIPCEDNAVLLMWVTAPKLKEAFEILTVWDFEYKTCAVWDKEIIGMGYWFRGQHELLVIGVKGKFPVPLPENRYSSVYKEKRGEHSKKPVYYYSMIEKMFPSGKYLELFARDKINDKWEVWGNMV